MLFRSELALFKKSIEYHSRSCSCAIFDKLVDKIIHYSASDFVELYKYRLEYSKNNGVPVYFSFWGDFQYEVLPVLPSERLKRESYELIAVLERKFREDSTRYRHYYSHSGSVSSPVTGKTLTAKNWLGILKSRKLSQNITKRWKEIPGGFIESTVEEFSRSFENVVSTSPTEYLELVLNNYHSILPAYIDSLLVGISRSGLLTSISPDLIEKILLIEDCSLTTYRGNTICEIIKKHEYTEWSQEIVDLVSNIAINHINPEKDKPIVKTAEDPTMKSFDMLFSNAINCVRGNAAQAIGHIIWKHEDYFSKFKETMNLLTQDLNPVVKLSSLFALWPSYNFEKEWASEKIVTLFEQDYRLAGFHDTKNIMFLLYPNYRDRIIKIIEKCYNSEDEELITMGSNCLTEMYILRNEFTETFKDVSKISASQANGILHMAIIYFDNVDYNEVSKSIIRSFRSTSVDLEMPISRLFYDNLIDIERDHDFLIDIVSSPVGNKVLSVFLNYLQDNSKDLIEFSDIIINLCTNIVENYANNTDASYGIDDELSKLIIGVYDEASNGSNQREIEISHQCLDLWDKLFESQIGSSRKLIQLMMER